MRDPVRSPEISIGYRPEGGGTASGGKNKLALVGAGLFAVGSAVLLALYLKGDGEPAAQAPAVPGEVTAGAANGPQTGNTPPVAASALTQAVERFLDAPVSLTIDGRAVTSTWRALGIVPSPSDLEHEAKELKGGAVAEDLYLKGTRPAPVVLDHGRAVEALVALKDEHDRPAVNARLDMDHRQLIPDAPGYGIDVFASLVVVEEAARSGKRDAVALAGAPTTPTTTKEQLAQIDIGNVMGWFETHYPPGERDRNHNLKVAAEKLDGFVLMPGQVFSFNEVVGDRTEKQGYRVAHVISAGEMVDGLAGGACQVSSTLHGASWFAGLEMVDSRPHSRPSAYVTMGMDATVVYPTTDLKMKNPYDFPVVFHYKVSQGTMRVEILGKKRPWDKIVFEREVKKEIRYDTIARDDPNLPIGSQIVDQMGFPGYNLIRRRIFYKDGKQAKVEKMLIDYPPTTEYVRIGTNPDPNLPPPTGGAHGGPMVPGGKIYRAEQ
jgi:vancomycin resistance protein YoaR